MIEHPVSTEDVQTAFVTLLPRLTAVIRFHLRRVRCPTQREDHTVDAVALCWLWFVRLTRRGRRPHTFVTRMAEFGARSILVGRSVCGSESAVDVGSAACARRHGVTVVSVFTADDTDTPLAEAVRDNTHTPVPDQVQFRLDFPAWVASLPATKRRVLDRLLAGDRPGDVANDVGVSAARVSQVRAELHADYASYCGDPA